MPPSGPIEDQTQERSGYAVEYVDVLPEARSFDGDPPPRATYGRDLEPFPPSRMSSGWGFVSKALEVLEDAEDEVIWETEDRRVLEVPCVVDTRDCCLYVLRCSGELPGEANSQSQFVEMVEDGITVPPPQSSLNLSSRSLPRSLVRFVPRLRFRAAPGLCR